MTETKTAAIIIIGNEILSGRTLDTNTQYIAKKLCEYGIDLIETRTIKDDTNKIVKVVKNFSSRYDYVITSGGIGPTHDDITSEAIALAFDVAYIRNEAAYDLLVKLYASIGQEMNRAREKMSFMPEGSELIEYRPAGAPGFKINNVYALAGVPNVMEAMLDSILPKLSAGKVVKSMNLDIMIGESIIAEDFLSLQQSFPNISMGSYPFKENGQHGTSLVLRSHNTKDLEKAYKQLNEIADKYTKA